MTSLANVIRRITIVGKTEGVDQATGSLRELAGAQAGVAVASEKTASATLSVEKRINSLQRSLDAEYRAEQNLLRINKDLEAARAQGLITAQRQAELSSLAAAKFNAEGIAATKAAAGLKLMREFSYGLAAGIGAGFLTVGLAQIPRMVTDAITSLADLQDAAETIGISTQRLQEYGYAGRQVGIDQETLNDALNKFSVNLGLAAMGSGNLHKILEANHLTVSGDLNKDFLAYADLIQNATNAEERNVLVTQAFGRSAQEMGRLFNEGAGGIRAAGLEAELAGAIMGGDALRAAKDLDDQMDKLRPKIEAAGTRFAIAFGPAQVWLLDQVTDSVKRLQFAIDSVAAGKVQDAIGILAGEGIGPNSRQHYIDRNLRAGTLPMAPGLSREGADDFYSSFPQIEKPVDITVGGGKPTKLPPSQDDVSNAKAYEKLIETTDRRIAQLEAEAAALGMTGVAADAYRNYNDLLNQAQAAGITITDEVVTKLHEQADSMAVAQQMLEGLHITMENRSPWEVMGEEIAHLNELMAAGAITASDYWAEVGKSAEDTVGRYASAATGILGQAEKLADGLGLQGKEAFEVQKAISIANAVVSGGEAVVKSYNWGTTLGGPVGGMIAAGLAAAATAAQIAAIASTTYQSKSLGGSAATGSAGAAPSAAAAPSGPQNIMNVTFRGSSWSVDDFRKFAEGYNTFANDGGTKIVLAGG